MPTSRRSKTRKRSSKLATSKQNPKQKLSRDSFELMVVGAAIGSDNIELGTPVAAKLEYETKIIDSPWDSRPAPIYRLLRPAFMGMLKIGAAALSKLKKTGELKFAMPPGSAKAVAMGEDDYVIASVVDLSIRLDVSEATSHGAAEQAMNAWLADHPDEAGTIQVVPAHEAEEAA